MRVAVVQFKADRSDKDSSLQTLASLARAAGPGLDLLVLPEMAATGYCFDSALAAQTVAERPQGQTFGVFSEVAATLGAWLVVGFVEQADEGLYNSALVIQPDGQLAFVYRKTLLFEMDTCWALAGNSGYRVFSTQRGSFTVGICMDLNDDRFLSWCALQRPTVVALPTCWLYEGYPVWHYWAYRIVPHGLSLAAANTWGLDSGVRFSGASAIMEGAEVLAGGQQEGDVVLTAELGEL